jgi:F-type H+-transporting ATPase subunit delta
MQNSRVGLRYAESLLSLAKEANASDAVLADMNNIAATINDNNELQEVLKSPIIASDKKLAILNAIFASNESAVTTSLIKLLCEKNREEVLVSVAEQFAILYKEEKKLINATVTTAVPMDEETRSQMVAMVNNRVEGQVDLTEIVDESIIGGFVLQIGDQRINNSVVNQLAALKREFESKTLI